jgi:predicted ATPase
LCFSTDGVQMMAVDLVAARRRIGIYISDLSAGEGLGDVANSVRAAPALPLDDAAGALVGRADELVEIDARLRSRRLVTLIGPGGVGKTVTAREAARVASSRYPLGIRFVDLSRVDDPDAVAGTVAAQLGFASADALVNSPADQPVLVVVDNCEHVLDAAAEIIAALLDACRAPTVLATSRSPLILPGESVLALAPLANARVGAANLLDTPTVQLFVARARDAGVEIGVDDLELVAEVCRRVDGLPLAIEIAAARTRSMGLAELLGRLDQGIDVLNRPRFRGASRHRSMIAVVRWSIDLLDPADAALLEWLTLLPGSFTLSDVRRLVPDADSIDIDGGIDALVDASLVSIDTGPGITGYRLLYSVHACARRRLVDRGELDQHIDRFIDRVAESVWDRLAASGVVWDPDLLRDVSARFDEIAQSLRWCVAHDTEPGRALSLCSALFAIVQQGRAHDIVTLARQVFERWPNAVSDGAPRAIAAVGTLATAENLAGNPHRAISLTTATLASRQSGWATVNLRRALGQSLLAIGDPDAAASAFAEGAIEARRLRHPAMALELELANAQLAADAGHVDDALVVMVTARDEAASNGSALNEVWASTLLAWTTMRRDISAGMSLATATLETAREIDYPNAICGNVRTLAYGHLLNGDHAAAADLVDVLYQEIRDHGALGQARMVVDISAALAYRRDDPAWEALAATVATLAPSTVLSRPGFDLAELPATAHPPLSIRDALRLVPNVVVALEFAAADDAVAR